MINFSPLDGRYVEKLTELAPLSEVMILIEKFSLVMHYATFICHKTGKIDDEGAEKMRRILAEATRDKMRISELTGEIRRNEKEYGHEMYAVIKTAQNRISFGFPDSVVAMVNFGLTSEDIVNMVHRKVIHEHVNGVLIRQVGMLMEVMKQFRLPYAQTRILGMTHGQPATPVNFDSVIMDFENRLNSYNRELVSCPLDGKMGGATGGLLAHKILLQGHSLDWEETMGEFIRSFGMEPIFVASQVNPNDDLVRLFGQVVGLNGVILDISRDMWLYIMRGIVRMEKNMNTVGSTAMPHKVNPIEFENAEGNIGLSTCIFQHMIGKLPTSRMQRDLSDSTLMRNVAVPFAHQYLAIDSLIQGFLQCHGDKAKMQKEIDDHPEVTSEIEQAQLKLDGCVDAADKLRKKWRS